MFVLSVVLISACGSTSKQQLAQVLVDQKKPELLVSDEESTEKLVVNETNLDPEILYLLLTSEIAGQKNQPELALAGYLRAARLVDDVRIAERAVKIALFLKAYPQAMEANELWLKNDTENLLARKIAAMLALMNNEKETAIKHLDFLLTADLAGFEVAMFEIVRGLGREGKQALVFEVLDALLVKHPEQPTIFFIQSVLAMQQKNSDLALKKINKALIIQPDWDKAVILQAQIVASSGDSQQTIGILTGAVEKWPEKVALRIMLARALVRANKMQQAMEQFEQVVDLNPNDIDSQYSLALLYLQLHKDDKARDIFQRLVDVQGWGDKASFQLGRLDAVSGKYKRARVWFDNITQGPYLFDAKIAIASLLIKQRKYQESENYVAQMSFNGQSQEMRLVLLKAELLSKQKRYEEAYNLLTATLAVMHNKKELLYTRALIAKHLGRIDLLENDLLAILKKHPNDASALNALGYTLIDCGERLDEAEVYLTKAIAFKPNEADIVDSYGWLKFHQGQYQEALKFLQKAYDIGQEPEISGHMIEVLWMLGRKDEARDIYYEALQKHYDDEYLLRLKQEIDGLSED